MNPVDPDKKHVAHLLANGFVRYGLLWRPDYCLRCHQSCKPQAHHPDYNFPLKIEWLCKECHTAIHAKNRTGKGKLAWALENQFYWGLQVKGHKIYLHRFTQKSERADQDVIPVSSDHFEVKRICKLIRAGESICFPADITY